MLYYWCSWPLWVCQRVGFAFCRLILFYSILVLIVKLILKSKAELLSLS